MASAADRSGASAFLEEPVVNAAPVYPYHICHKNGFVEFTLQYTPLVVPIDIDFVWEGARGTTNTGQWSYNTGDWSTLFAACPARNIIVQPRRFFHFANGLANAHTAEEIITGDKFQQGWRYKMRFTAVDVNTLRIQCFAGDDTVAGINSSDMVVAGLFAGNPVFTIGYPTTVQAAAVNLINPADPSRRLDLEGIKITSIAEMGM